MKKSFIILGTLFVSGLSFAQVGVNTDTPQATLDVVGKPTDTSSLDGVIAPRITGAQLRAKTYTGSQEGALVYVITADPAPAGQTVNVTNIGYYYFDGTLWQTVKSSTSTNIYNANGSLTSGRTLTLNGFQLNFTGTERSTYWDTAGRIHQRTTIAGSDAAMGFHAGGANLWIQQWYDGSSAITASGTSTALELATHFTIASAPITLSTSVGGNTTSLERMRITGEGNVGINTTDPTEKLDNNGITRLRTLPLNGATNAINTTSTGDPSSAQDQTFTATKTVVADANGVMGSVDWVASPPLVMAGGDAADATSGSFTISSSNNNLTEQTLTTKNFTLTKKSLVTFSYSVGISNVLQSNGSLLTDGNSKLLGTRLSWASLPAGSSFTVGNTISRSSVPYTQSGNSATSGFFFLNGSRAVILDPGSYGVNLIGYVSANDSGQGVRATFGPGAADQFDIIAVPIP